MHMQEHIAEFLVTRGAITTVHAHTSLEECQGSGADICEWLMARGHLTEQQLLVCLAADEAPAQFELAPYIIPTALTAHISRDHALQHGLLALHQSGDMLTVALAGRLDHAVLTALEHTSGYHVLPLLCSRTTVRAAIEQYYPPSSGIGQPSPGAEAVRLHTLVGHVRRLESFPLLPDVHMRLLEQLDDPEVEIPHLTALAERDPTLTANVLRMANSAAYASGERIADIETAVVRLGLQQFHNAVLASAVLQQLDAAGAADFTEMFEQAYSCGLLTRIIADVAGLPDRDTAFTAGLLADMGRILIHVLGGEHGRRLDEAATDVFAHVKQEEALLGLSASELAYHLARRWQLPDILADAIRYHDRLDRTPEPPVLARAVGLAKACLYNHAAADGSGDPAESPWLADMLAGLGMTGADLVCAESEHTDALTSIAELGLA